VRWGLHYKVVSVFGNFTGLLEIDHSSVRRLTAAMNKRTLGTAISRLRSFSVLTHRGYINPLGGLCVSLFSLLLKLGDILMPEIDKIWDAH